MTGTWASAEVVIVITLPPNDKLAPPQPACHFGHRRRTVTARKASYDYANAGKFAADLGNGGNGVCSWISEMNTALVAETQWLTRSAGW
jgi:hypothetical protein